MTTKLEFTSEIIEEINYGVIIILFRWYRKDGSSVVEKQWTFSWYDSETWWNIRKY